MNCPSRTDEPPRSDGLNQSPNAWSNDLTTNQDLKGMANARRLRRAGSLSIESAGGGGVGDEGVIEMEEQPDDRRSGVRAGAGGVSGEEVDKTQSEKTGPFDSKTATPYTAPVAETGGGGGGGRGGGSGLGNHRTGTGDDDDSPKKGGLALYGHKAFQLLKTFAQFVGPGFIVSVAYIDPGNYSTDIAAGASYRYKLLFVVLLSNIFAIFLQSLCVKLGSVSGRNLAEACRAFLPRWLNYFLYFLAEVAIIATDIAEVIGTAIALNLLQPKIPLVAGCAISIVDVLVVLVFVRPTSASSKGLRAFELLVAPLVLGVVICFCIELSIVKADGRSVLLGYVPSSALIQQKGLYQACGILGATVMPHSLYLGSGIVQPRLRAYDEKRGLLPSQEPRRSAVMDETEAYDDDDDDDDARSTLAAAHFDKSQVYTYIPSLQAIRSCMKYSIAELAISLFTFALFVNSAILVVAGTALYNNPDAEGADIFAIHNLLSTTLSKGAGTIFALALLLSGISAGVVCTIAGQMVCEGAMQWTIAPWLRRLLTRSISILPSIIIAGAVGRSGLDAALNGSQVVLSVVLPFVTAPLLWFTCCNKYMTVQPGQARMELRKRYKRGQSGTTAASEIRGRGRRWLALLKCRGDGEGAQVAENNAPSVEDPEAEPPIKMANSWPIVILGVVIWVIIAAMNVANLVLLGMS